MPLPPALLNRLKKRGLVKDEEAEEARSQQQQQEEEVIAEDYDDKDIPLPPGIPGEEDKSTSTTNNNSHRRSPAIAPAPGCPNKWNLYHECTTYCHSHWGSGKLKPVPQVERLRLRMLKKYPLPDGWKELYDPGTGRHYYWKITTDEVCWLSPSHPRATVTMPADKLRAIAKESEPEPEEPSEEEEEKSGTETDLSDEEMEEKGEEEKMEQDGDSDTSEEDDRGSKLQQQPRVKESRRRPLERIDKRGRVRAANNDLDPMDPAAYSDIPRGSWSAGLEKRGEGKTGIDTTANGPLYQMRPYPNPGAVLRLNAENEKRDKK